MTDGLTPGQLQNLVDELEIRSLAERYAGAVDERDAEAFISVFEADATLYVHPRGLEEEPSSVFSGHEQLAVIVEKIKSYPRTFHFVGNHTMNVQRPEATGEVYCIAHHLTPDRNGATDFVMLIRYRDTYRRTDRWRIAERRVCTEWNEHRATGVAPPQIG